MNWNNFGKFRWFTIHKQLSDIAKSDIICMSPHCNKRKYILTNIDNREDFRNWRFDLSKVAKFKQYKFYKCKRCRIAKYCSKKCQKKHWNLYGHQPQCVKLCC